MEALLALDCGNRWTGWGLVVDGEPRGELHCDLGRRQAARLPLMTENFLRDCGLSLSELTYLAITVGPGYFTSLRIGLAYGNGLAWSLGIGVVPLSSLEVLAATYAREGETIVPLIAASRRLAFSAVYKDGELLLPEKERDVQTLERELNEGNIQGTLVAARDERLFSQGEKMTFTTIASSSGLAAATLGWKRRAESRSPFEVEARYLREPGIGN